MVIPSTEIGLILLAAGNSARMGQSKQLLKVRDESLLVHSITVAVKSGYRPIVVLGANEKEHRKAIEDLPVDTILNLNWKNGMGGSLKAGLTYLLQNTPLTEALIVMVCDQPLLTSEHLKKIKEKYQTVGKGIVASGYADTSGVPALFHKSIFPEIMALSDELGAKSIIQKHLTDTITIDFPEGSVDLDTPTDYQNFIQ